MDLELTDDQRLVQSTARHFLDRERPLARVRDLVDEPSVVDFELWKRAAELGWFAPLVPEEDGGGSVSGQPVLDAAIVVEEAGRALFPGPLIATNVVAAAIARNGTAQQRADHLAVLIDGSSIATWAFAESSDRWSAAGVELAARPSGDRWILSGAKSLVEDATSASLLLVTARHDNELRQFLVPAGAPGLTITALQSLDLARRFGTVEFAEVHVPADALLGDGDATDAVDWQLDLATALTCCEMVGALDRCFEMTLEYAHARRAFGRPIGSFQALKHRFADMLLWLESAKAIASGAATAVEQGVGRAELVSAAKAFISHRGQMIVRDCLQIHGGIGYTWEHDLHFLLRRVDSDAVLYGAAAEHRDRIAQIVGL